MEYANIPKARELIIALPEIYTQYEPQQVLTDFTEEFRRRYGVECVSALHHNKRKTNYHIHLIFSERKLLPEPDVKIASRSVFFDETGKRVRTKKEITGEDGQIRKGCTVIKKGEVYESHLFTTKDTRFKGEPFLREVKEVYTELINRHISDPEQHLKVFDKDSVYLPTKKIGKNNPKEDEIKADNAARQEWNRTADMALLSGISEAKILEVKRTEKEIAEKLDKLPDVLKEDGYPDVQAFMATYRKAEAVVEQYNRDLAAWGGRSGRTADQPKKKGLHRPKRKVFVTSSGGYRQRADREASQSENPTTEKDSFNAENNTAGQYPCLAGLHTF